VTPANTTTFAPPLAGKIAVITGADQGVGFGIAEEFIAQGASVVITGRRQPELDHAVSELGPKASAIRADVSVESQMQQAYQQVIDQHGHLDTVVANAGVGDSNPLGKITEEQFDHVININLKGVLFTVQLALPHLPSAGTIVVIGSTASIQGLPGMAVYGSAKAGLRGALRAWIQDITGTGVRINILSPGAIDTPSLRKALADASGEDNVEDNVRQMGEGNPLGRLGSPREIGKAAAFLSSDASSFITGIEMFVDGGMAQSG
jgi:NAD(P)-dependent dehydrogenase (short-subunit alcohol dehydrogenase family)